MTNDPAGNEFDRHLTELILDAAGEGVYGLDCDGLTTFVNPAAARMLGYPAEELIGASMHLVLHHSRADGSCYPSEDCPIYAAFHDGLVHTVSDEVFWRRDDSSFPVEYTSTPIRRDGELCGAVVVFRDVSERVQAERNLRTALTEVQELRDRLSAENEYLQEEIHTTHNFRQIIGDSAPLRRALHAVETVAPTDAAVLITGETGTGKELIARAIHDLSGRRHKPLIKVNCASIPRELFESEFFGHVRGAFTGAVRDRMGRFELADRGTLFLDEVGEIPIEMQSKLLRVLQDGNFERVGEPRTRKVDVRVIAATNRELREEIAVGRFREDLYYRLNVFPIPIAPLRNRRGDIPALASHFLQQARVRLNRPDARLTRASLTMLQASDWPGNVRELQNVIERAVIRAAPSGALRMDLPEGTEPVELAVPTGSQADSEILPDAEFRRRERANTRAALEAAKLEGLRSRRRGRDSRDPAHHPRLAHQEARTFPPRVRQARVFRNVTSVTNFRGNGHDSS